MKRHVQKPNENKPLAKRGLLGLDPAWAAFKRTVGTAWPAFVPLARFFMPYGITPADVDETVLRTMVAQRRLEGTSHAAELAERVRRAIGLLRAENPKIALPKVDPSSKRATPRQDQWARLDPALRADIERWQSRSDAPAATALVAERNLLLRAIDACERAGVRVASLQDLIGDDALVAVLKDEKWFGTIEAASTTRSKFLEFTYRYAESLSNLQAQLNMRRLLEKLPKRHSQVSVEDLEAATVIASPANLHKITSATVALVSAFTEAPSRNGRKRAQNAIGIRLVLTGSYSREELMRLRFDGAIRTIDGGTRPTMRIDRIAVEERASDLTRSLIDGYWRASLALGLRPDFLFDHASGRRRDETSLSEAVRRIGQAIGIGLTLTLLEIATVILLVKQWKDDPDGAWSEAGVQHHLRIEQIANLRARFSPLFGDDAFQAFADRALGDKSGEKP